MREVENAKHAEARGKLLTVLAEDYTSEMTTVGTIARSLDALGFPLAPESLCFHLTYLSDKGYLRLWRNRDLPSYRSDRVTPAPGEIRFAKILPLGVQLIDGEAPADPKVTF